jgi:hypothetical protein
MSLHESTSAILHGRKIDRANISDGPNPEELTINS